MSEYAYELGPDHAEEVKRRTELARQKWAETEVKRFWAKVLDQREGRAEIWRILNEWNAFRTEFRFAPAGMTDTAATWFWHGRQTAAFEFYQHLCVASRDGVNTMHDEHDPRYARE